MVKRGLAAIALLAVLPVMALAQWGYVNTLDDVTVSGTAAAVFSSAVLSCTLYGR